MMIRYSFKIRSTMLLLGALLSFLSMALADELETTNVWKYIDLLDGQTRSSLFSQERFFNSMFQLPSEYTTVSESQKKRFVNQWMRELQGKNSEKITEAAANLGIVRAKDAVKKIEKALARTSSGRIRWVCTRSLGQIGDRGSIPVLISLLDNRNTNTRVYAQVALAEITGAYFGDNKEGWKNWEKGGVSQSGTSIARKAPEARNKTFSLRKSFSRDKLVFCLPDSYGRIVDSHDYANVPVLIMSGSCWCGGCQQDAEPLRKIAAEFSDRGLATIRTVAGDNELAALDFQKHYRLPFVQLLDTNRSFEKRYNRDGWTFLMLADRDGKIVYKINSPHEKDWFELRRILGRMLSSPVSNKTIIRDGVTYMRATLQRSKEIEEQRICERFPSIACAENGQIYVVFTTNRNGSSDVFLRVFDGSKWSKDMPIAATAADEYDGMVLIDKEGYVWVCWTSNIGGRYYDIFASSFANPLRPGTPARLTYSDDGAMHPGMVCDKKGRIWITYYKWHKMGRYSRDKEVYVRKYEHGKWSDEVQVSPTDVPQYEDHSDPAIMAYGNRVVVAWSWDFHPPNKGYSNQAKSPTIFMRTITDTMNMGNISCVSGKDIDVTPVLVASDKGEIWCAWDSLGRGRQKNLCISNVFPGRNNPTGRILSPGNPVANVCTPSLAAGSGGRLILTWSETEDNANWVLKRTDYDRQNKKWSAPQIIENKGNPRYCSTSYDSANNLWLAYSVETEEGRKVVVVNTGKVFLKSAGTESDSNSSVSANNTEAIKRLRQLIDEKYSYSDLRSIDWGRLFKIYTPRLEKAKTSQGFAESAAKMLLNARDMHLWVKIDGETIGGFKRKIKRNYNIDFLRREVPGWRDLSQYVSMGRSPDNIGYILIKSWRKDKNQVLNPALKAIRNLSNTRALIIDVRPNGGGSEPFAAEVAGCFIDRPIVYAKHVYRDINTQTGWGQTRERILKPNSDLPAYQGKIAVLMGQANMSSCEAFLLMMKQIPNCKLIGEKSYGSSGNPKPYDLGNGVTIWLPSWKALRPDEACFEGQGIKPDINVRGNDRRLQKKDPVLESALKYLRSPLK